MNQTSRGGERLEYILPGPTRAVYLSEHVSYLSTELLALLCVARVGNAPARKRRTVLRADFFTVLLVAHRGQDGLRRPMYRLRGDQRYPRWSVDIGSCHQRRHGSAARGRSILAHRGAGGGYR